MMQNGGKVFKFALSNQFWAQISCSLNVFDQKADDQKSLCNTQKIGVEILDAVNYSLHGT